MKGANTLRVHDVKEAKQLSQPIFSLRGVEINPAKK